MKRQNPSLGGFSDDELAIEFAEAARLHGVYTETGEYRKTNAQYHRLAGVYKELRGRGTHAQRLLLGLLESKVVSVRVWAAMYALEFAPGRAEPILEQIASGTIGHQRTDAEIVLREWKAGNLKF
ncbi:MAG: DUF2019 domain-containing protein [Pyrinomonadaceae bacterium]